MVPIVFVSRNRTLKESLKIGQQCCQKSVALTPDVNMIVGSSCGKRFAGAISHLWSDASEAETLILTEFQLLKVKGNAAMDRESKQNLRKIILGATEAAEWSPPSIRVCIWESNPVPVAIVEIS